jgi:hypothetical protein
MDPLSITTGALSLAANVLKTTVFVKEVVDQLKDAPSLARDIEDDIAITQGALRQVEAALAHDPRAIWRFRLDDVFDVSVKGCLDTLQRIDEEFESFFERDDWRARLGVWWIGGDIRRLLGRLEAKKGSLMLLVQALSLYVMQEPLLLYVLTDTLRRRSVQDMQDLLQQNRATLDIARLGLEDMVPTYPAYKDNYLDSVASEIGSDDSVLGDRDSVLSHTRFPFDEICFGSKAYRRTVGRVSTRKALGATKKVGPTTTVEESDAESGMERESRSSDKTATPTTKVVVESAVHEAVCLRLQQAEARIRALEGLVQQKAALRAHDRVPVKDKGTEPQDQLPPDEPVQEVELGKPDSLLVQSVTCRTPELKTSPSQYVPCQAERRGISPVLEGASASSVPRHPSLVTVRSAIQGTPDLRGTSDLPDPQPTAMKWPGVSDSVGKAPDPAREVEEVILKGGKKINSSQTSLLLEYFEIGKVSSNASTREPSARVRRPPKRRVAGTRQVTSSRRLPVDLPYPSFKKHLDIKNPSPSDVSSVWMPSSMDLSQAQAPASASAR